VQSGEKIVKMKPFKKSAAWLAICLLLGGTLPAINNETAPQTYKIIAKNKWLFFPVKSRGTPSKVQILVDGEVVRWLGTQLTDKNPDWWAPTDISQFKGKTLTLRLAEGTPEDFAALSTIHQGDKWDKRDEIYHEPLRPLFHFSSERGWLNDTNGPVYYGGEYHLFYQHNPVSWKSGGQHWGHAVSRDLVHWTELGEALYPDKLGPMYSGSAVVDKKNTSGFGADGIAPLVLVYTAAGSPHTQCVAYSTDGRHFTKYSGNPVVPWIGGGNRDPQVFWHEPTQRWIMAVYVDGPVPGDKDVLQYSVHILTSPNLRDWTPASVVEGGRGGDYFLSECPNLFPLAVDGDPRQTKWVLMGAYCAYVVGTFDGKVFVPETPRRSTQTCYDFTAPQVLNNEPHGRVVQIGWLHAESPGMPFNQCMSVPRELTLRSSPGGPRLCVYPIKELEVLRGQSRTLRSSILQTGSNPLEGIPWQVTDIMADLTPGKTGQIIFDLHGKTVTYKAATGQLIVDGVANPLPLVNGSVRLRILIDRTSIEIYGADGLVYVPAAYIPSNPMDSTLSLSAAGEPIKINTLECYKMNSIWLTAKD